MIPYQEKKLLSGLTSVEMGWKVGLDIRVASSSVQWIVAMMRISCIMMIWQTIPYSIYMCNGLLPWWWLKLMFSCTNMIHVSLLRCSINQSLILYKIFLWKNEPCDDFIRVQLNPVPKSNSALWSFWLWIMLTMMMMTTMVMIKYVLKGVI